MSLIDDRADTMSFLPLRLFLRQFPYIFLLVRDKKILYERLVAEYF